MATNDPKLINQIAKELKDLQKQVENLNAKLYGGGNVDASELDNKYREISDNFNSITEQIEKNNLQNESSLKSLTEHTTKSLSTFQEAHKSLESFSDGFAEAKNTASTFFGSLTEGLNKGDNDFQNVINATKKFRETATFEGGVAFWRDYARRIRDVGVEYGLSAGRLNDFKESNLEIERSFVDTGKDISEFTQGISSLYAETGRVNQLTPDLAKNMGNISRVMGISTSEVGTFLGKFNDLNVSFNTSTKLLEDLRYSAEKSALNTGAVLKKFTENFERMNTFSFKNGVNGMMDLVKQSFALKVNMDDVLKLSDKLTDPEATMDFAANMQMLGGSFAQLGDFNQLMYDAAVAPEDLAKNIAKATSSLGSFDKETGKFSLGFADRMQLKQAASQLGMSEAELNKMATTMAKVRDMKMSINIPNLTEDQMNVLGSMAQFDTGRGEYTVKVGGETKSVAELSEDDIKKISETGEEQTFEQLNVSKMDTGDVYAKNIMMGQYSLPDYFKALGGDSEDVKKQFNTVFKSGLEVAHENLKLGLFQPIENFTSTIIGAKVPEVLDVVNTLIGEFAGGLDKIKDELKDSDFYKAFMQGVQGFLKSEIGVDLKGNKVPTENTEKKSHGDILSGPSHTQGGIPFTIGGKSGFEAEGGEVLLTKGVSQNSELLSMASKINEIAGGKKLFAKGGVVSKGEDMSKLNINNVFDPEPIVDALDDNGMLMSFHFKKIADILNLTNEELANKINKPETPNLGETKFTSSFDSGYVAKTISEVMVDNFNKQNDVFLQIFKPETQKNLDLLNVRSTNMDQIGKEKSPSNFTETYEEHIKKLSDYVLGVKNEKNLEPKVDEKGPTYTEKIPSEFEDAKFLTEKYFEKNNTLTYSTNLQNFNQQNQSNNFNNARNAESLSQLSENVMNNFTTNYTKELGKTNIEKISPVSPIKEVPSLDVTSSQGQLPSKIMQMPSTSEINVGGVVTGNVEIKIPSFEVTVKGMGGEMTKEMNLPDSVRKDILEMINSKIGDINLYNLQLAKKGGVNDGKPANYPGFLPATV